MRSTCNIASFLKFSVCLSVSMIQILSEKISMPPETHESDPNQCFSSVNVHHSLMKCQLAFLLRRTPKCPLNGCNLHQRTQTHDSPNITCEFYNPQISLLHPVRCAHPFQNPNITYFPALVASTPKTTVCISTT